MTDDTLHTTPDDAEIYEIIIAKQTARFQQLKEYFHLSPQISGWKYGKITYSTPSPEDNAKRDALVKSWDETRDDYGTRLASFGSVLPDRDPVSQHFLAPKAIQALRQNDPEIFKSDPHALLIAEAILLRVLRERLHGPAAPLHG